MSIVGDLIQGFKAAVEMPVRGAVELARPQALTMREWAQGMPERKPDALLTPPRERQFVDLDEPVSALEQKWTETLDNCKKADADERADRARILRDVSNAIERLGVIEIEEVLVVLRPLFAGVDGDTSCALQECIETIEQDKQAMEQAEMDREEAFLENAHLRKW